MAEFLLVHGSCHGAWCWKRVIPFLESNGHKVQAIDLPGHGNDQTPVQKVTLDAYAEAIAQACGQNTQLVGHSMGGYAIAAAARLVPEKIAKLIYLCAYVPREGLSLAQMRMQAPRQPLLPAIRMRADGISFTVDAEMAKDLFYHDCSVEDARDAVSRLCPQATAPTNVPFVSTPQQTALPRHYIRCRDDRTIPPEFQIKMTDGWDKNSIQDMSCGHSPFFADPEGLAKRLDQVATG